MNYRFEIVFSLCAFLLLNCCQYLNAQESTKLAVEKPSVRNVRSARNNDLGGEAEVAVTDYELTWPSIPTHQTAHLFIVGDKFQWSQKFIDGAEPVFNAFEEDFKPGSYRFQITYTSNESAVERVERKDSITSRRELLKKRLELMRNGDAAAAKAVLKQANEIRAQQQHSRSIAANDRSDSKYVTRKGQFVVKADGKLEFFNFKQEQDRLIEEAKENGSVREKELAEKEELDEGFPEGGF